MEKQRSKNRIEKIVICHEIDESPDISCLGTYTNECNEWNIDRKTGEYVHAEMTAERIIEAIEQRIEDLQYVSPEKYAFDRHEEKIKRLQKRLANIKECSFDGNIGHGEYQYFAPYAGGAKPGTPDYKKYGKQDYARMESLNNQNWYYIGIIAKAETYVNGTRQTITSGGLWGMKSDGGKEYIEAEEKNQLAELKENLLSLGFGARAIQYAINKAERKE